MENKYVLADIKKTKRNLVMNWKRSIDDSEWDLCDDDYNQLYKITGLEQHDWDEGNLAHFIDGMQRALHLIDVYEK